KNWIRGTINISLYGLGIVLIIGLTFLPYYSKGIGALWWQSVIEAPLAYANSRRYSLLKMAPTILTIIAFFMITWKKGYLDFKKIPVQVLSVAVLGILLSFVQGGRINSHYLIQLYPMLLILVGLAINKTPSFWKTSFHPYLYFILLLIPIESYREYYNIIRNKIERGTFFNGEGFTVPNYIKANSLDTENIIFLGYHIGYWVLDTQPPTKAATHPSNLCREEMFFAYDNPRKTSVEELRYIMEELKPKTVVLRHKRAIFDKKEVEENAYMTAYLKKHYALEALVENAEILQRLE
ncbi:MAG: glycosyltransferase, partial [Bacteroidota bacterium]